MSNSSRPLCPRPAVDSSFFQDGEVEDDLVRDMVEVLTSFCARLYGRRSAKNRAAKTLQAAAGVD